MCISAIYAISGHRIKIYHNIIIIFYHCNMTTVIAYIYYTHYIECVCIFTRLQARHKHDNIFIRFIILLYNTLYNRQVTILKLKFIILLLLLLWLQITMIYDGIKNHFYVCSNNYITRVSRMVNNIIK